jgi:hypothetical protein
MPAWVAVCVVVVLVLTALAMLGGRGPALAATLVGGGSAHTRNARAHVVVDTLNLAHRLRAGGALDVLAAIDATAPRLRRQYPGRVMYVLKDHPHTTDAQLAECAGRNRVYIYNATRFAKGLEPAGNPPSESHSAMGRDDHAMGLLAAQYHCAVLTEDRMRDYADFRALLRPYYITEHAFWRDRPARQFVRPESTPRLRRPPTRSSTDLVVAAAAAYVAEKPT